jgi:hypothetical protein
MKAMTYGTVLADDDLPKLITGEDIEPGDAIDLDNDGKPYGEPRTVAEVRELHEGSLFYVGFSDEQPGASFAFDESVWLVFRPDVQGMAEAAEERMHDDLDALLRREVDAALGHGNWTGDVDPPLVAAFHLHLVGVLRQLIQNGVPAGVKPAAEPAPEPQFTISIDLANQGMRTARDVADVLVTLGEHLRETERADEAPIRDTEGNTVGHWSLVLPEPAGERSTYDTNLTEDERDALASDLEGADWHSPAADIRAGLTPETVLSRLRGVDTEDDTSEATEILDRHLAKARERHVAEDPDLPGIDPGPLQNYEIMQSVIAVVLGREETTPAEINAYLAEEGAETLYDAHIAPAITTVEQAIRGDLEPVGPEDEST